MRRFLFILLFFSFYLNSFGFADRDENPDTKLIADISSTWMINIQPENTFLPFIAGKDDSRREIYFFIDVDDYKKKWLQISHRDNFGLFVNGKLAHAVQGQGAILYSLDSLVGKYQSDRLMFSIYSMAGFENINTSIVVKSNLLIETIFQNDFLNLDENKSPRIWDFFKISSILIIIIVTLLFNIDSRTFRSYFNIGRTFSRPSMDEFVSVSHKINKIDLLFILALSLLMGFLLLNVLYALDINKTWLFNTTIWPSFLSWLIITIILVFWYFLKVVVISVFSSLFNLKEIKNIHLFEYLRITSFYGITIFFIGLLMLYVFEIDYSLFGIILTRSLLIISILRLFILFYKISNSNSHKKLFLFAYICTAELIPMIIGLKLILNSALIYYIV